MDSFELEMSLGEFGLIAPDRCKACPRLGNLAAKLSSAQEDRNFLTTSSNEEVLTANARTQLAEQMHARYPGATDEQIANTVENSVANYLSSESYTNFLKQAGALLEQADVTVAATVTEIDELLVTCPPEGCGTS